MEAPSYLSLSFFLELVSSIVRFSRCQRRIFGTLFLEDQVQTATMGLIVSFFLCLFDPLFLGEL